MSREDRFVNATLVAVTVATVTGVAMSLGLVAVVIWALIRAVEKYL